jgi:hypothetical protein
VTLAIDNESRHALRSLSRLINLMISDTDPVALFLAQAREKRTTVDRPKSKMEPHRELWTPQMHEILRRCH